MKSHHRVFHKLIPAVQVILQREDGKILMMRRSNTGFADGQYGFAAGHVEDHETPREAAVREVAEEADIQIKQEDLQFVHVIHRLNMQDHSEHQGRIEWAFVCKNWVGQPKINEPDKCDHLDWFDPKELPGNTVPYLKQVVGCWQKGEYYSEHRIP